MSRDDAPPLPPTPPSPWVARFAPLIRPGGAALDLACGGGRHSRLLLAAGHPVTAVDIEMSGLDNIGDSRLERIEADLEGGPWPLAGRRFDGIVVTNYLHRPRLDDLLATLAPGGVLIYETFAAGNERHGRPASPDFLLRRGELLAVAARAGLTVLDYEDLEVADPRPACVQRLCARRPAAGETAKGEP